MNSLHTYMLQFGAYVVCIYQLGWGEGNSCSRYISGSSCHLDYFLLVLMIKTHRVAVRGLLE